MHTAHMKQHVNCLLYTPAASIMQPMPVTNFMVRGIHYSCTLYLTWLQPCMCECTACARLPLDGARVQLVLVNESAIIMIQVP